MEKPNIGDLFYFIKPREQETSQNSTECHNLLSQSTSRSPSGTNSLRLINSDLSSIYDRFVRPYKEKGVERDPTYLPYINMLPGKMNIVPDKMKVPDKSLKKLINKPHRKCNEKYSPEKSFFDSKAIERNMLNLFKPGLIPGFDPAEFGLDEEKKTHSTSQITPYNNNRSTINSSAQGNLLEMGGDEKSHEKKKKKKHKVDYDGEKRKKHKHDKEHRKNSTDGECKKKKRKKEKERLC